MVGGGWFLVVDFDLTVKSRKLKGREGVSLLVCCIMIEKDRLCTCLYTVLYMFPLPPRILVEADYFSLWQYLPDTNNPRGYVVRVISIHSQILPDDICLRADNWGYWFFYELHNQGWPHKPVLIDADGFNKIGHEIASFVKVYVGEHSIVGYRPVLPNGGYGRIETVLK